MSWYLRLSIIMLFPVHLVVKKGHPDSRDFISQLAILLYYYSKKKKKYNSLILLVALITGPYHSTIYRQNIFVYTELYMDQILAHTPRKNVFVFNKSNILKILKNVHNFCVFSHQVPFSPVPTQAQEV